MPTSSTTSTDAELVELARDGHRAAFDELIQRHDERMRSLAFRLLADRHAMDDALQEAYLKALKGLDRFRPGRDFGTWLYRVTYNACIDELRRRKRARVSAPDQPDAAAPRPAEAQLTGTPEAVRLALAGLSDDQRVTVVLVDAEGFDHQEAADILGIAPGTVASRLYRARTKLRRVLWDELR